MRCFTLKTYLKVIIPTFILIILPSFFIQSAPEKILIDDFENGISKEWKEKSFKGKTSYTIVNEGGNHILRAESIGSASGLIYKYSYDPKNYPILLWKWKVENILKKGDATKKQGDDFAARIYVVFPHWFPPKTKSLNYIWANKLKKGSIVANKFYSKAILIAVESGEENIGKWISEKRNVYQDYKDVFNEEPPKVGAIAIMTDTDQTGERALAYYDDIYIKKGP